MIFKTTSGQRVNITPKQRVKHVFYQFLAISIIIIIIFV